MLSEYNAAQTPITDHYLARLNNEQLIDLLQHKTQLLVTASMTRLVNQSYIIELRQEVEMLQRAIRNFTD